MGKLALGTAVSQAIKAVFDFFKLKEEVSDVKRMAKAIDAAEKYIQANTKTGKFTDVSTKKQKAYLKYYEKRFFNLNN